jgi:hypothetical protein
MESQPWLDSVRQRLARHDLPPSYAQRFTEELRDHLEDLKEENMEADAISRLGEPEQVADNAVAAYRRRSFLGRHPVAAFLVLCVLSILAQFTLFAAFAQAIIAIRADHTLEWHENHWILSPIIALCSTFLGILYAELAVRFGIGRKGMLASYLVLGAVAMLEELCFGVTWMLPVQLAVPLAVGWWSAGKRHNWSHPATTLVIFVLSPVASYTLFWLVFVLVAATGLWFVNAYLGSAAGTFLFVLLVYVVPAVAAGLLCWRLAKRFRSGRRWLFVSCMALATIASLPFMPLLLIYVVPTVVASLLYCKLARRFRSGRRWLLVSCLVIATFAPMKSVLEISAMGGQGGLLIVMAPCVGLAQFLVPLAIGWLFLRRTHDYGQLQAAS